MIRTLLAELAKLRDPRTLKLGVISGYVLTACFALLVWIAVTTGAVPWHWLFAVLLGAKLVSNTLAWIGLAFDRFALELGGINVAMDAVVMTGAVWATGDVASPIVAVYTIEVTVLALLTNLACTVLVGAFALVLYIAMALLVSHGVLPRFETPVEWGGRNTTYIATAIAFTAFVIVAPTIYTAGLLRRLRERERALEAKTLELVDAGKQKAQFMANITHELRTPLQGIMGLSDLVAKNVYGDTTDKQRHAMTNIKTSAKRLHAMIDELLQVAMHDAGKLEVKITTVDLDDVIKTAGATAQWLLAGKQLEIVVEVSPAVPLITSDRTKVNQIVLNLLSNAIKFTPDGGKIVLRARPLVDGVELEVEDTGVGIGADELGRVFDEFYQVDGSSVREYGGVGLGLALVKRLAELLGGGVRARSEVGRGSTFTVKLPLDSRGARPARHLRAV